MAAPVVRDLGFKLCPVSSAHVPVALKYSNQLAFGMRHVNVLYESNEQEVDHSQVMFTSEGA